MTLMRFDPFRELDRFSGQVFNGRSWSGLPMEAFRRGDEFMVAIDVPGAKPEDVEVSVERNVVNVRATRTALHKDGDEVIVDERPQGEFTRQLFLGDNLDPAKLTADVADGVLTLTIPVAEESKPRRIQIAAHSA
jgi:HSP20 family protein